MKAILCKQPPTVGQYAIAEPIWRDGVCVSWVRGRVVRVRPINDPNGVPIRWSVFIKTLRSPDQTIWAADGRRIKSRTIAIGWPANDMYRVLVHMEDGRLSGKPRHITVLKALGLYKVAPNEGQQVGGGAPRNNL